MANEFFRDKDTFLKSLSLGFILPKRPKKLSRKEKKIKFSQKKYARDIRKNLIKAYGGCCVCCGEYRQAFLTIDHIFRDGKIDRQNIGSGYVFYRHLEKLGYPKDRYRLLCMNCNFVQRYGAPCPHEVERKCLSREVTMIQKQEIGNKVTNLLEITH